MASKVLGQYDLAPERHPAAAARRPQPRPGRARARASTRPTSGSGSACTRRPTGCSSPPCPWLRDHMVERARSLAADLAPDPEQLPGDRRRASAEQLPERAQRGRRRPRRPVRDPRAAREAGPGHRGHVPARGARRRRHGRGRPRSHPARSPRSGRGSTSAARACGAFDRLLRRLLGLEAKMRQYRDGAVFVRGVIDEVGHRRLQPRLDLARRPCRCPRDRGARGLGRRASTAEPGGPGVTGPHPAVAGRRAWPCARCSADCDPGDLVLVACSGGADSLALAAAVAFEAPRLGHRAPAPSSSTTACSPARPPVAASGRGAVPRPRPRPGRGRRRRGRRRPATGLEAAARAARYAALEAAADRHGAAARAARPHPRRPGRAGAARPHPRRRRPVPVRYAGRPAAASAVPCSGSPGRRRAAVGRGRRACDLVGRPDERRPGLHPGPGPPGRSPTSSATSGPGWPRPWPARPTSCARTPTTSTPRRPRPWPRWGRRPGRAEDLAGRPARGAHPGLAAAARRGRARRRAGAAPGTPRPATRCSRAWHGQGPVSAARAPAREPDPAAGYPSPPPPRVE